MKHDFLFFFTDSQGRSYYEKPDGTIGVTNIKTPVQATPEGWQQSAIQFGRSLKFPGMFRTFTVPLKGMLDSSRILKYLNYVVGGVEAACSLIVEKLNRDNSNHENYYKGDIDFSTFSDEDRGAVVQVMEGGLSKLIRSNENTTYEIPLDVPEVVIIDWDGIEMESNVRMLNTKDYIQNPGGGPDVPNVRYSNYTNVALIIPTSETQYPSMIFADAGVQYQDSNNPGDFNADDNWVMKAMESVTLKITSGILQFTWAGALQVDVYWHTFTDSGVERFVGIASDTSPGTPKFSTIDLSGSYDFNPGEKIYLVVRLISGSPSQSISFAWPPLDDQNGTHEIIMTYNYRKAPTDVKALRATYVFDQIIKKMSDGKYSGASALLDAAGRDIVLTSGDGIRGFAGAVIKTSLNDFITSYDVPLNLGFGIEKGNGIIEAKKYFFSDDKGFSLGEVNNFKCSPALDHIFNEMQIGYLDQNYQDVNGRNEFNTTWQWTFPIRRVVKKLDLQSKYRADPYGAEFTRINLTNKTTTDSLSDNDAFMINIESAPIPATGKYRLNRPDFDSILGIISPSTIFNILLSPKRALLAHGNYLRVGLMYHDTEYIVSQTADKNQDLVTIKDGIRIAEKDNVLTASLDRALFLPYIFDIVSNIPENLVDLMLTDQYKKISFTWKGVELSGYILECSQVANLNPSQNIRLLCSSDVDISKLVNVM